MRPLVVVWFRMNELSEGGGLNCPDGRMIEQKKKTGADQSTSEDLSNAQIEYSDVFRRVIQFSEAVFADGPRQGADAKTFETEVRSWFRTLDPAMQSAMLKEYGGDKGLLDTLVKGLVANNNEKLAENAPDKRKK